MGGVVQVKLVPAQAVALAPVHVSVWVQALLSLQPAVLENPSPGQAPLAGMLVPQVSTTSQIPAEERQVVPLDLF